MKIRNQFFLLLVFAFVVYLAMQPTTAPSPNPDDPTPGPVGKMQVAFIVDENDKLTQEQTNEIASAETAAYLNDRCGQGGWRVLDPQTPLNDQAATWGPFLSEPRKSTPWMVIKVRNRTKASEELPANQATLNERLRKYGGK